MKIQKLILVYISILLIVSCSSTGLNKINKENSELKPLSEIIKPLKVFYESEKTKNILKKLGNTSESFQDFTGKGYVITSDTYVETVTNNIIFFKFSNVSELQMEALNNIGKKRDIKKKQLNGHKIAGVLIEDIETEKTKKYTGTFGGQRSYHPGLTVKYSYIFPIKNTTKEEFLKNLYSTNAKTINLTISYLIKNKILDVFPLILNEMEKGKAYDYAVHKQYVDWYIDQLIKERNSARLERIQKLMNFYSAEFTDINKELIKNTLRKIEKYFLLQ